MKTDYMSERMKLVNALNQELLRQDPSESVIALCEFGIRAIDRSGHAKTFIDKCQPEEK